MGDISINDLLAKHFICSQMQLINRIRIFLQIMYTSDVTDISGRYLLPNIRDCMNYRKSIWEWPAQVLNQEWTWKINSNLNAVLHNTLGCFEIHQGRYKEFYVRCNKTGDDCTTEVDMCFNWNKLTKMAHKVEVVSTSKVPVDHFKIFLSPMSSHILRRRRLLSIVT